MDNEEWLHRTEWARRTKCSLERAMGFEPTTTCLGSKDSTTELRPLTRLHPTLELHDKSRKLLHFFAHQSTGGGGL